MRLGSAYGSLRTVPAMPLEAASVRIADIRRPRWLAPERTSPSAEPALKPDVGARSSSVPLPTFGGLPDSSGVDVPTDPASSAVNRHGIPTPIGSGKCQILKQYEGVTTWRPFTFSLN